MMHSDVILSAVIVLAVVGWEWVYSLLQLFGFQESEREAGMSENPFKVGDTVVCVKPCHDVLKEGSEWVVKCTTTQYVELEGAPDGGWYHDRFKLKEAAPVVDCKFKVGDTVVCMDAEDTGSGLVQGKEYRVRNVTPEHVWLEGEVYMGWKVHRFQLKEAASVPVKPEFKVGDTVVCFNAEESDGKLIAGNTYTVTGASPAGHYVWLNNKPDAWRSRRFEVEHRVPAESPEDWVEITDPNHVLRGGGVDFVKRAYSDRWDAVCGLADNKRADVAAMYTVFRCRRKDHPDFQVKVPEPATNVHCGGPYVARSEYERVLRDKRLLVEENTVLVNGLKSNAAKWAEQYEILTKDNAALEKQRDALKRELDICNNALQEWKVFVSRRDVMIEQMSEQLAKHQAYTVEARDRDNATVQTKKGHLQRICTDYTALDRWAEAALPAIVEAHGYRQMLDQMDWSWVAARAYECAKAMVQRQQEVRWEE